MKRTTVLALGALGLLVVGSVIAIQQAMASTRTVAVAWVPNPTSHTGQYTALVSAASDTGADVAIDVRLVQVATGTVVGDGSLTVDPDTPLDDLTDSFEARISLGAYPSGTQFMAVADFKDASGNVNGTATMPFTKP